MVEKQLSRKEREYLRHKQEILKAALQLFSEKGYYDVSMQQIAEASEFAVGTLYNFFESKNALFIELLEACGDCLREVLIPILKGPGDEEFRIRQFIRATPELLQEHADLMRLYASQVGPVTTVVPMSNVMESVILEIREGLTEVLASGIRKERFRQVDPKIAALSLQTTIGALAFEVVKDFNKPRAEAGCAEIEKLFIDGLLSNREKNDEV